MTPTIRGTSMAKPVADAPFDDPKADIVLLSSDGVLFYVHKLLLALVSPIFDSMFTLCPDQSQEMFDGRPCVSLSDESKSLRLLLSWCDQRCTERSSDLGDLQIVLEMADKYCMDSVIKHVEVSLSNMTHMVTSQPLRMFCIAARFRFRALAYAAVAEAVKVPFEDWNSVPELKNISGLTFFKLSQYQMQCVFEATMVPTAFWLIPEDVVRPWTPLAICEDISDCPRVFSDGRYWKAWWVEYMHNATYVLAQRPHETTLDLKFLEDQVDRITYHMKCTACREIAPACLIIVQNRLAEKIRLNISLNATFTLEF